VVQSFYYDDKPTLSNEEFDNLKEELLWAGSKVAILRYPMWPQSPCIPIQGVVSEPSVGEGERRGGMSVNLLVR